MDPRASPTQWMGSGPSQDLSPASPSVPQVGESAQVISEWLEVEVANLSELWFELQEIFPNGPKGIPNSIFGFWAFPSLVPSFSKCSPGWGKHPSHFRMVRSRRHFPQPWEHLGKLGRSLGMAQNQSIELGMP